LKERFLWTEPLTKLCSREKKAKSNCEERVFYGIVRSSGCGSVKPGRWVALFAYSKIKITSKMKLFLLETVLKPVFYPIFHCNLSYIEYHWAAIKRCIMYPRQLQVLSNNAACRHGYRKFSQDKLGRLGNIDRLTTRSISIPCHKAVTGNCLPS
jgi:hypothetical protein